MQIDWIAPPADLKHFVHTFYRVQTAAQTREEPSPAYSAQLSITLKGMVELEYAHGAVARAQGLFLNAPQLQAGKIRISGPTDSIGASLTPLGWAALTGHAVDMVHDCAVSPETFVDAPLLAQIMQWHAMGGIDDDQVEQGFTHLQAILRSAVHPVQKQHREFIAGVTDWLKDGLSPSLDQLYASLPFSQRQIQRLSRRFFGATPTQVLLRHRAIRLAMLLSNPDLPRALFEEVGAAYFDQAHMIRNVRRFTGRTPADFAAGSPWLKSMDPEGHGETASVLRKS